MSINLTYSQQTYTIVKPKTTPSVIHIDSVTYFILTLDNVVNINLKYAECDMYKSKYLILDSSYNAIKYINDTKDSLNNKLNDDFNLLYKHSIELSNEKNLLDNKYNKLKKNMKWYISVPSAIFLIIGVLL